MMLLVAPDHIHMWRIEGLLSLLVDQWPLLNLGCFLICTIKILILQIKMCCDFSTFLFHLCPCQLPCGQLNALPFTEHRYTVDAEGDDFVT